MDSKRNIRSLPLSELSQILKDWGVEKFRLQQVLQWIYERDIASFEEMSNLSKKLREQLVEQFSLERLPIVHQQVSEDGTRKFLIQLPDGETIESVLIPNEDRQTLCISSQVGCAMACRYCLTGLVGLKRHLSQFEILEQVMAVKRAVPETKISNIVFMGMGEPLHNLKNVLPAVEILVDERCLKFSKRKVTVSTSGLVPEMLEFGKHSDVKLAISLCATTNELRDVIVPINRKYPLEVLLEACKKYPLKPRGRITMEYVMLAGVNDSLEDAARLLKILKGVPCKVNLIPFNEFPGSEFKRPSDEQVRTFQKYLLDRNLQTNIRTSRGRDILGACGQLKAAMEVKSRPSVKLPISIQVLAFLGFFILSPAFLYAQQVNPVRYELQPESKPNIPDPIDHYVFSEILKKFVSKNSGLVDYRTFKRDKESIQKLDAYVADLSKIDGFALEPVQERKAYWLNLYNALVLKEIIHHYPVNLTAEINHFFDDKRYEVAAFKGEKVSLLDLEQKVFVDRLNDPRTHLARVNGAISGPIFSQEAFQSLTVDKKLDDITLAFLTDSSKNFYDARRNIFFVSPLFLWFQEHFGRWEHSNRFFIQKRLQGLPLNFRMEYMGFDWKLNDTRNR